MRTGDEIGTETLLAAMDAADAEAVILQLCDLTVHVVQSDALHIVDQPLPAGCVEAAH